MLRSIMLVKRFTKQQQSLNLMVCSERQMSFVGIHQDVIKRLGTNEMGFQLARKVVLLGA